MISADTRARWRKLMADATRGPWAAQHGREVSAVNSTVYKSQVAAMLTVNDAALVAEGRAGWTETLDELERAEAAYREMQDANERLSAEVKRLRSELAEKEQDRAMAVSECVAARREAREARRALVTEIERNADIAKHTSALVGACSDWLRHRHSPNLIRAIEEFKRCLPGS